MSFPKLYSKLYKLTQIHLRAFATTSKSGGSSTVRTGEIKSDAGYGGSRGTQSSSPTGSWGSQSKPTKGKAINFGERKSNTQSESQGSGQVRSGDVKSDAGYGGSRGKTS